MLQVVFLDFNHHYAMDAAHHVYLINTLQEVFGSRLCHNCTVDTLTLDYLWDKKHQVRLEYICICLYYLSRRIFKSMQVLDLFLTKLLSFPLTFL